MITGQLKNKIDALWDIFFSGGISNPLDVIEQITYLMFIHDLASYDEQKSRASLMLGVPYKSIFDGDKANCKWSSFRHMQPEQMFEQVRDIVFPFIKSLQADKKSAYSRYMKDAIFKIPTPQKLVAIVESMDQIYEQEKADEVELEKAKAAGKVEAGQDIRGDLYEYMLSKLSTSGDLGQFRTPRHIIRMMVEMVKPTLSDTVCDPACGTAGFLIETCGYIKETFEKELFQEQNIDHFSRDMFSGRDIDPTMLRIAAMNMMMHGVEDPHIDYRDGLARANDDSVVEQEKFSVILANPPFKGRIDKETISPDLLKVTKTSKTELLFLALFLRLLKIGGRAAVIVPDGVLFGSSGAHKSIRKEIVEKHRLQAVISLPSGIFKPYAGVSTAILLFTKTGHGGTENVWFYDMKADGYSLDDKRQPIESNDIPDIISRWNNLNTETDRKRTDTSFFVPKAEIVEKDYDLSINKYKEVEYEKEELPPSESILQEIIHLENQFENELETLKKLLNGE